MKVLKWNRINSAHLEMYFDGIVRRIYLVFFIMYPEHLQQAMFYVLSQDMHLFCLIFWQQQYVLTSIRIITHNIIVFKKYSWLRTCTTYANFSFFFNTTSIYIGKVSFYTTLLHDLFKRSSFPAIFCTWIIVIIFCRWITLCNVYAMWRKHMLILWHLFINHLWNMAFCFISGSVLWLCLKFLIYHVLYVH